jgi:hypothetical protein
VTAVPSGGRLRGMHRDVHSSYHDRRPVDALHCTEIGVVPAVDGAHAGLVAALTDLVNGVYAVAEEGLWVGGATRTTPAEVPASSACSLPLPSSAGRAWVATGALKATAPPMAVVPALMSTAACRRRSTSYRDFASALDYPGPQNG